MDRLLSLLGGSNIKRALFLRFLLDSAFKEGEFKDGELKEGVEFDGPKGLLCELRPSSSNLVALFIMRI